MAKSAVPVATSIMYGRLGSESCCDALRRQYMSNPPLRRWFREIIARRDCIEERTDVGLFQGYALRKWYGNTKPPVCMQTGSLDFHDVNLYHDLKSPTEAG